MTIKPLYAMHDRLNAGLLIFSLCALFSFSLLPLRPPTFGFYVLSPDFPGTVKRRSTPLAHAVCMAAARIFPRPKKAALWEGGWRNSRIPPSLPSPSTVHSTWHISGILAVLLFRPPLPPASLCSSIISVQGPSLLSSLPEFPFPFFLLLIPFPPFPSFLTFN